MNDFQPEVCIIIPIYNCSEYYLECLTSVFLQNYEGSLNIVVVDNESTDTTLEKMDEQLINLRNNTAAEWAGPRSIVLDQAPNVFKYSWSEPTREGLKHLGDSEYFIFVAGDDVMDPDFISNYMKIIGKNPEKIKLLQSPVKFFGAWNYIQAWQYKNLDDFKNKMLERSIVNTPTLMWHRSYEENGLVYMDEPSKYFGADDYGLYCELATRGHFIYPAPKWLGYNYRIHPKNTSWDMHKDLDAPNTIDKQIQERYRKAWSK